MQVTIFERESHLGGRIHSVHTYDGDGRDTVELGAHTFDAEDALIAQLAQDVGAELQDQSPNILGAPLSQVSVWDGERVVFQQLERVLLTWESFKKLVWQNLGSRRFWDQLVVDAKAIWHRDWHCAKWVAIGNDGPDQNILVKFARAWGLSVKPQKVVGNIDGMCRCRRGDTQALLEKLVQTAQASVHFNSTVTQIERHDDDTYDVHWAIKSTDGSEQTHVEHFDTVVLAHAFGQTEIQFEPPLKFVPKRIAYAPLHITYFVSRRPLDPATFNLPANAAVPDVLWNVDDPSKATGSLGGQPSFLTLTRTTRAYLSGCLIIDENVYKVTSREFFSNSDIAVLLNRTGIARETITFPDQARFPALADWPLGLAVVAREDYFEIIDNDLEDVVQGFDLNTPIPNRTVRRISRNRDGSCKNPDVRWVHRHYWPNGLPVVDDTGLQEDELQKIELAPSLFYTSGFESRGQASISKSVASALAIAQRKKARFIIFETERPQDTRAASAKNGPPLDTDAATSLCYRIDAATIAPREMVASVEHSSFREE